MTLPSKRSARVNRPPSQRPLAIFGLLAIAQCAVLGLALLSYRAVRRQARVVDANLEQFAGFAATNFSYRSASMLFNHAIAIADASQRWGAVDGEVLVRETRRYADSLYSCRCELGLPVQSLALLDSLGRVVARGAEKPIDLAPSVASVMWARARKREEPPLAFRFIEHDGRVRLLTMTRVRRRGRNAERFLLASYDGDSVAHRILTRLFRSRPTLLPAGLAASRENADLVSIRITLASGAVVFRTPHTFDARWRASVPFGQDSTVSVQVVLSPTIASEVLGASDPRLLLPWLAVMTLLVSVVIAVIAALAQRAASLAKVRGDFTAAVSHELRTPLTEIMLYAELIVSRRAAHSISATEAGRVILAEARRLYQLVENVLVIARTDRRMLRVRMATHDLRKTVADAVRSFEPLAAKRSAQVQIVPGEEVWGIFDPSAVAGVMLNLLENAARYGPRGQRIDVRVGRLDESTAYFEVDDAGPGIPIADRERVFSPYVRLPRDEYESTSGSGIGLAVVKSLVEEMHGRVTLDESSRGGVLARVCVRASREPDSMSEAEQSIVESDVSTG